MNTVDTIMLGGLGPAAMGGGSLGGMLFFTVAVFGNGLLYGLDTLVAQAAGARDYAETRRSLAAGVYLSLATGPLLVGVAWLGIPFLKHFRLSPDVLAEAVPYLRILIWSTLPLLLFTAFRRSLQAIHATRAIVFAIVSANLVNAAGNWMLIYGHWGAPAMGTRGSALATTISRVFMMLVLGAAVWRRERGMPPADWRFDFGRIRRLVALGLPAATQISAEVALWALAAALVARLDAVQLAANTVALNVVSIVYMFSVGISSAAAVRVGNAVGRRDAAGARRSGWAALALVTAIMALSIVPLTLLPGPITRLYTSHPGVLHITRWLLLISAAFELFDGIQTVVTGALRGLGDTRRPMLVSAGAYWLVGLPAGYLLCFQAGWGVYGIWTGLCLALILMGALLLRMWHRAVRTALTPG